MNFYQNCAYSIENENIVPEISKSILSELINSLNAIASALDKTNKSQDPIFMQVGLNLQSVYTESSNLSNISMDATKNIGDKSNNTLLNNVSEIANKSLSELQNSQLGIENSLKSVEMIALHLGALCPRCEILIKIAKQLRTISMYFAIESSRSDDSTRVFSAFTKEMTLLVDNVFSVTQSIRKDSIDAKQKQIAAYENINSGARQLKLLTDSAEITVKDAANNMNNIVTHFVDALETACKQSQEISHQVSNIVMAIQFHDITRQQIEHIIEAFTDVENMFTHIYSLEVDSDQIAIMISRIFSILKLQAAQLNQVISVIEDAYNTIECSFVEIGISAQKLAVSISNINNDNGDTGAASKEYLELKDALESLNILLSKGKELTDGTNDAAKQASDASILLNEHVEEVSNINTDINLQALNAVINSVRLHSTGSTLAVLSQEVTNLSNRSGNHVDGIVNDLNSIIYLAHQMENSDISNIKTSNLGKTGDMLKNGINLLSQAYQQFICSSQEAVNRSEKLQTLIIETGSILSFLPKLAKDLQEIFDDLECIIEKLTPYRNEDSLVDELYIENTERYTMESERNIHRQTLGISDSNSEETEKTSFTCFTTNKNDTEEDDLGDNFELF